MAKTSQKLFFYKVTAQAVSLVAEILRFVGQYEGFMGPRPEPQLRRQNRIRSIQGSLSIEGNSLSQEQISAILENKRVIGPKREILEVQNAIRVYDRAVNFDPFKGKDFLRAHHLMMNGLIPNAGQYRKKGIGIFQGRTVKHLAPPPERVFHLMDELFQFLKKSPDHRLITSAVAHYEIEFIHPFSDGNGRMGRFWQHVMLSQFHPLFQFLPVESVIRERQRQYYSTLSECDRAGESTRFIEFSLLTILQSLKEYIQELKIKPLTANSRLGLAVDHFQGQDFSRKDYRRFFKTISSATASRDLKEGVQRGLLKKQGDKANTRYQFRRPMGQ